MSEAYFRWTVGAAKLAISKPLFDVTLLKSLFFNSKSLLKISPRVAFTASAVLASIFTVNSNQVLYCANVSKTESKAFLFSLIMACLRGL